MPDQKKKQVGPPKVPDHVFIEQGPESFQQDHSRLVSSQARRFQSAGKRQQQRISAKQGAGYARSLVGWRSTSSTPSESRERISVSPLMSSSPEPRSRSREVGRGPASEARINLALRPAPRMDPFSINVWAPHKTGNFDELLGYNTQLDLCWPAALQDDMLFDATIAVSRTAWVLAQGKNPSEDHFMLYHRGLAMKSLRQKLSSAESGCREAVLFTIGRMVSIAYMSSEPEAFNAHFEAFRELAQKYVDENHGTDVARVIGNRLDSWKTLHEYRNSHNLLCNDSGGDSASESDSHSRSRTPTHQPRAQSPNLLAGLDLAIDLARSLKLLVPLLNRTTGTQHPRSSCRSPAFELLEHCRRFCEILRSSNQLTPTDLQLCCALAAFCLQLYRHLRIETEDASAQKAELDALDGSLPLEEIAKTFLNHKLDGFYQSDEQRMILTWSALVLGSLLLQQPENQLRTKGHIIHINLSLHLGLNTPSCSPDTEKRGWRTIELILGGTERMGSLWNRQLVPQWYDEWQGSLKRQQRWETQGVWMIGAPKRLGASSAKGASRGTDEGTERSVEARPAVSLPPAALERYGDVDIIEYLVLREARDSLPRVE